MVTQKSINTDTNKQITSYTTDRINQYCNCGVMQPLQLFGMTLPHVRANDNPIKVLLNQMADTNDVVLMCKANTMLMDGVKVTQYGKYKAEDTIQEWQEEGIITHYTEPNHTTHNARTISVKHQKGVSDLILKTITHFVESSFVEFYTSISEYSLELNHSLTQDHLKPTRTNPKVQQASDELYGSEYVYQDPTHQALTNLLNKQVMQLLSVKKHIDTHDRKFSAGMFILELLYPLLNGGRRDYVISKLYIQYEADTLKAALNTQALKENPSLRETFIQWLENEGKASDIRLVANQELEVVDKESGREDQEDNLENITGIRLHNLEGSLYMEYKNISHIYNLTTSSTTTSTTTIGSGYIDLVSIETNPYPCTTLPLGSFNQGKYFEPGVKLNLGLLVKAYEYKLGSHPEYVNTYNELALLYLCGYEPANELERRCKEVMIGTGEAFPLSYLRLSECPRLYAGGKDNLFYCPSRMRQALSKAMELREWDMKSCHTNILLGLFPSAFPVLRGMVERDSIWKEYEEYFTSKGCVFNKQVVKACHYATILGGGKRAYREGIKKLRKEGVILTQEESEELVETYSKHPVVREMKGFINKWGNNTKSVTYPTGESHEVIGPELVMNESTGKLERDYTNSNVLRVFSGLLRAWEMVLISYVGLSHPEAFTILLHQHDGITVVEHESNAFELAQGAMREISNICFSKLSKPIELEIKV